MADKVKRPENDFKKPRMFIDDASIKAQPLEIKSWDLYDKACKEVREQGRDLQEKLDAIVKAWSEFEAASLKAYKKMPQNDAMFSDSPFSPMRMQNAFRQNLAKLGWRWAAGLPWGPDVVKPFFEIVDQACTWGQRIVHDQERAIKIEAAEKLAKKAQEDIKTII